MRLVPPGGFYFFSEVGREIIGSDKGRDDETGELEEAEVNWGNTSLSKEDWLLVQLRLQPPVLLFSPPFPSSLLHSSPCPLVLLEAK